MARNRFLTALPLVLLSAVMALAVPGCVNEADEAEDFDILLPLTESEYGLTDAGAGQPGVTNGTHSDTDVWVVRNEWDGRTGNDEAEAGPGWSASSGLSWEEKYVAWVDQMAETAPHSGYGKTFIVTNPQGKQLPIPYLECAELAMTLRVLFASWYGLPFFMEATDAARTRIFAGHFGFRTLNGRYRNSATYASRYRDYSNMSNEAALANWPTDSRLRDRHLYGGGSDNNLFIGAEAGAGWYFDELLLNKRVGYFLTNFLPFFGSINLADDANTYHVTPPSIRAGDILLKRWQRRGIGHVMLVKAVAQRPNDKMTAELASGSMPRRQAVWESQASSKRLFTNDHTGGEGENRDGDAYVDLGGGAKRWPAPTLVSNRWTNRVLRADEDTYIPFSRKDERRVRPAQFGELLVEVGPEEMRDDLLALIESKREHLRNYPASCSARISREEAFEELYTLMETRFGMSRDEVDAEYRILDDYVFAELEYTESKTCCWNSTTSDMYDIIMGLNESLQEHGEGCVQPTVFKWADDGYHPFTEYAGEIGQGGNWVPWSADESCPAAETENDVETVHGWTPWCELAAGPEPELPDPYEDNNTEATAYQLEPGTHTGARITEGDTDWFRVDGTPGSLVRFTINFSHAVGDLELEMRVDGEQVDTATGSGDEEAVDTALQLGGTAFIRVHGYSGATGPYSITVVSEGGFDLGDPCDDDNQSLDSATLLPEGQYNGLQLCTAGEEDWFRIPSTAGEATIRIEFDASRGDLELKLYRSNGDEIASSTQWNQDFEEIDSPPGSRYLRVYGSNDTATNSYSMFIGDLE